MNRLVRAQLVLEEWRKALGTLLDIPAEDRSEDFNQKLETAKANITTAQTDLQTAAQAEPVVPEHRQDNLAGAELRAMEERANVGELYDSILSHGQPHGAMAELQQHLKLQSNQIPLSLISGFEERAVTPAPGQVGQNQQGIISYVFPQSSASFLGVDQPTVPVGEAVYTVLTSELAVGTPAENAAQDSSTGAYSASVLTPQRLQSSLFYSIEDRARFSGMDSSLRENLSAGLADGLDKEILSGTNGLFSGTNLPNNAQTTNDTFDSYLSNLVWNQIDGRYASMASDLSMVVGAATYKDLGQTYRNTSVDRSALDRIMELVSGVRVSAHVPGPSTNRQNCVIRRGGSTSAVAPLWEGVTIIADEVTLADKGQIKITAVMLFAMKVLRTAGGLVKQGTDHS